MRERCLQALNARNPSAPPRGESEPLTPCSAPTERTAPEHVAASAAMQDDVSAPPAREMDTTSHPLPARSSTQDVSSASSNQMQLQLASTVMSVPANVNMVCIKAEDLFAFMKRTMEDSGMIPSSDSSRPAARGEPTSTFPNQDGPLLAGPSRQTATTSTNGLEECLPMPTQRRSPSPDLFELPPDEEPTTRSKSPDPDLLFLDIPSQQGPRSTSRPAGHRGSSTFAARSPTPDFSFMDDLPPSTSGWNLDSKSTHQSKRSDEPGLSFLVEQPRHQRRRSRSPSPGPSHHRSLSQHPSASASRRSWSPSPGPSHCRSLSQHPSASASRRSRSPSPGPSHRRSLPPHESASASRRSRSPSPGPSYCRSLSQYPSTSSGWSGKFPTRKSSSSASGSATRRDRSSSPDEPSQGATAVRQSQSMWRTSASPSWQRHLDSKRKLATRPPSPDVTFLDEDYDDDDPEFKTRSKKRVVAKTTSKDPPKKRGRPRKNKAEEKPAASGPTCPICKEDDDGGWVNTKCGHLFHKKCLDRWVATPGQKDRYFKVCPLCGTDFDPSDTNPVFM
ncbi:hypothetical protein ONE63_011442 [Megalurothrips usitatus]|uniref:RING-type domain-containing protein n=1 Tax=Megalurothrips usitatus TaxID=439358 RepID=A0AAV7X4K9_9NEOP|nr:hypothetical protein ONE63_011442 [Megalurothrips usitatus]